MYNSQLVQKIYNHLVSSEHTPLKKLQSDLLKMRDTRLAEVVILKAENGTVKASELLPALALKGLHLDDVADSEGYTSIAKLAESNIIVE